MSPNNNSSQERPNFKKKSIPLHKKYMTQECSKCNKIKELKEFYSKGKRCKDCVKTKALEVYHKTGGKDRVKAYREAHPDWYRKVKKKAQEVRKIRNKTDPMFRQKVIEQRRLNSHKNFSTVMLARARKRAMMQDLNFTLTKADIIIPSVCPILLVPFSFGVKGNYPFTPSIDRVDPSLGYTPDNIKIICSLANTMKNCATKEQLLTFCKTMPKYLEI